MITIREYNENDAAAVGILIADIYREFNLSFAAEAELRPLLGPFYFAHSQEQSHQIAIVEVLRSPMMYVAEVEGEIVGVLRGRRERLASLFVHKAVHGQGTGRQLVNRFEQESIRQGVTFLRVAATIFAVPFYIKMGYMKSTGVRTGWSFEGNGLQYQPMKKILKDV